RGSLFLCLSRQWIPTFSLQPGCIGTAVGSVGKDEPAGRVECDPGAVLSCPVGEFRCDDDVASARVRARQWHDDQLLLGGEFEPQVAIVATKLEKLIRG